MKHYDRNGFSKPSARVLKRRKQERLLVDKGIYALLFQPGNPNFNRLGQIIDISTDGVAFHYITDRNATRLSLMQPGLRLKIMGAARMFELDRLTVVYDIELDKYSTDPVSVRRCGIKFGQLSRQRTADISRIIGAGCRESSIDRS